MAFDFNNAATNNMSRGASLISGSDPRPISLSIWLKAGSASSATLYALFSNNASGDPRLYWSIRRVSGSTYKHALYSGGYNDIGTFTNSTAWSHYGLTWDTDDTIEVFRGGTSDGTGSDDATGGSATTGCFIGSLDGSSGGFDVDGELAAFGAWNAILTATEFAALGAGYAPSLVRPTALVAAPDMVRSATMDRVAGDWTENGTLTVTAHPRVIYPTHAQIGVGSGAPPAGLSIPIAAHHYRQLQGVN